MKIILWVAAAGQFRGVPEGGAVQGAIGRHIDVMAFFLFRVSGVVVEKSLKNFKIEVTLINRRCRLWSLLQSGYFIIP